MVSINFTLEPVQFWTSKVTHIRPTLANVYSYEKHLVFMRLKLKNAARNAIRIADEMVAKLYLGLFQERPTLTTLLFHGLFKDRSEVHSGIVHPMEELYVSDFRLIIDYFLQHNYKVIAPDEIDNLSNNPGKYLLLTFDDGYWRSSYALSVLREYSVPAIFFISTNHVQQGKCFWWDALYRERRHRGSSDIKIGQETQQLKQWTTEAVELYLTKSFGVNVLQPRGDSDRPLTPAELRELASEPLVHLGNHTCDHAILTNYPADQVRMQIVGAQEAIVAMTGIPPRVISYPNGNHSNEVIQIAQENGLRVGVTCVPYKNQLPVQGNEDQFMRLGRFTFLPGQDVVQQCERFRADISLYRLWRNKAIQG